MPKKNKTAKTSDQGCLMSKKQSTKFLGLLFDLEDAFFDQGYQQAIFNLTVDKSNSPLHTVVKKHIVKAEDKAEKLSDQLCGLLGLD